MNKIFHYTSTFKTLGEQDDGSIDIKGSASTNGLDRAGDIIESDAWTCLLYTSPSPRDVEESRMPSSA